MTIVAYPPQYAGPHSYEEYIGHANRVGTALHIHVPMAADDDYVSQLGQLCLASLQTPLQVELGVEVWDGGRADFADAKRQGVASRMPGSNAYYQAACWHVWRSLQVYSLIQAVYGQSAMGSQVVRIIEIGGNLDTYGFALRAILPSEQHNPTRQVIDRLLGDHETAVRYGAVPK